MTIEIEILQYLHYNPLTKRSDILPSLSKQVSDRTLMRMIADGVAKGHIEVVGRGPATRYRLTPQAHVTMELNLDTYFDKDVDERQVLESFNFELINEILPKVDLFTDEELQRLDDTRQLFRQHLSEMSELEYRKEMERLGIDLSWKSSQIEGNTYSLLETERLLKEKQTASGKTKEEAVMLLNHKDALDFILDVPDYLKDLTVARIEEIQAILTKELGVERSIRHRRVGITGTNYTPLDNEFHIRGGVQRGVPELRRARGRGADQPHRRRSGGADRRRRGHGDLRGGPGVQPGSDLRPGERPAGRGEQRPVPGADVQGGRQHHGPDADHPAYWPPS